MSVCIPPQAKATLVLEMQHDIINKQLTAHPDDVKMIAGEFNHANLKYIALKFRKMWIFPTRGNNVLDQVYTDIQGAFKAAPYFPLSHPSWSVELKQL